MSTVTRTTERMDARLLLVQFRRELRPRLQQRYHAQLTRAVVVAFGGVSAHVDTMARERGAHLSLSRGGVEDEASW